jgi:5-(carboxyamino)imidazole ribonucleotide synthase
MRVGVLGGGQLEQMLAHAGHPLGISVDCFADSRDVPASHGGSVTLGDIKDVESVRKWAQKCDVVTYAFENFPIELVSDLAETHKVSPPPKALAAAQDRWFEKRLLDELDIPVTPFRLCTSEYDVDKALSEIGPDVVFKTRTGGYDGKGQVVLHEGEPTAEAVTMLGEGRHLIAEQLVDFVSEVSVVAVRSSSGDIKLYPPVTNVHKGGILRTSIAASGLTPERQLTVTTYMTKLMEHLEYVGVIALEMFITPGQVIANEIAPRVHNSGHWTIEGADTSQFENHLRAICGLPLGSTELRCPSAMVNIIGEAPDAISLLEMPGVHIHTYQKQPRPGRKLGHITITATDRSTLNRRLDSVRNIVSD